MRTTSALSISPIYLLPCYFPFRGFGGSSCGSSVGGSRHCGLSFFGVLTIGFAGVAIIFDSGNGASSGSSFSESSSFGSSQ